jgi:Na+/H+ antiporter NhaD/arsenite permease-like protein
MASPLYDEETNKAEALEETTRKTTKVSSLRRWGPAMIAVALVIAMNAYLMGPNQNNVPTMSPEVIRQYEVAAENYNMKMVNNKDISPYTRRRHRKLGEYVHKDVAYEFSLFGKISVTVIYFAFWVFLMFPNWFLPIGRPGIALGGGLSMVVWRFILQKTGDGPYFDAEHVIIFEPLFLLFGLMLTTIYLEKMERGGLFDILRESLDDPINWKRSAKIMTMSTIGSAAVMNDSIVLIFSGVVVDLCVRHKVTNSMPYLLSLATTANIGSALTMTGNPQNILIVSLAYDNIGWLEFAHNMILPVIAATIINSSMMFIYYGSELFPGSSGFIENFGIMTVGNRTPEMLAQEHAYYARQAANKDQDEGEVRHGWSVWSRIQAFVVILFLFFFAAGFDVCVVSICAGAILMVVASYKRQHYDPKPVNIQYDAE